MAKVDYYKCKWRGTIPGSAHSRCKHPKVKVDENVFGAMMDMMAGKTQDAARELEIKGHPHGIRSGWFMWPANFDPVWLENCNGFEPKTEKQED